MSLISLLIALIAERQLSSVLWQFNHHYRHYLILLARFTSLEKIWQSPALIAGAIAIPVVATYVLLAIVEDGLLHLILSTLILIMCFGCVKSRQRYKQFLHAAYRGELTSCDLHRLQLVQDKNLSEQGFGQALIWLNYRYYFAIMLFFVLFGAPGAVFYRLVATMAEKYGQSPERLNRETEDDASCEQAHQARIAQGENSCQQLLTLLDWLPVRIASFGYMFVGHFSRALPVWLESLFDFAKAPNAILSDVAEKAEDFMIDEKDCAAEPCILVKLAKRNILLFLAVVATLTLFGVTS